jgi:hypothetical protein
MAALNYSIVLTVSLLAALAAFADDEDALIDEALYLINAESQWTGTIDTWLRGHIQEVIE